MDSVIVQLFDTPGFKDIWSVLESILADSLINKMKKNIPGFDSQLQKLVREEWSILFQNIVSPNGPLFILFSDVYSKYFTADEIKTLIKFKISGGEISDADRVVLSKYISLQENINNDFYKGLESLMKIQEYEFKKRIKIRLEKEGLLNEEDFIFDEF
jgi:hypothetical protein